MKPIKDALDFRKAEKIATNPHHLLWQRVAAPQVFTPKRSEALGIFLDATGGPLDFPRRASQHEDYPWMQVVLHGFTPKGIVYADLWSDLATHQARVEAIPRDRWWRCQGMMFVSGAPRCFYITVYPESHEEAKKRAKHLAWAKHGNAWSEKRTFYQIHEVKPDVEAFDKLRENALAIYRMVKGGEKERENAREVRTELVSRSRKASSEGAAHGA